MPSLYQKTVFSVFGVVEADDSFRQVIACGDHEKEGLSWAARKSAAPTAGSLREKRFFCFVWISGAQVLQKLPVQDTPIAEKQNPVTCSRRGADLTATQDQHPDTRRLNAVLAYLQFSRCRALGR